MTSPAVFSNPEFTAEVMKEIDTAVTLLSQSIGIRIIPESAPIVGLLGQVGGTYGSGGNISGSGADFSLDGGHLGAILQITKGKKLINRSIKLLSPPHRYCDYR